MDGRDDIPGEPADESTLAPILAYLITAARTQVDEAPEYGPLRLLTAAGRLAAVMAPTASPQLTRVMAQLAAAPPTRTASADPARYRQDLDELCVAVAEYLLSLRDRQR